MSTSVGLRRGDFLGITIRTDSYSRWPCVAPVYILPFVPVPFYTKSLVLFMPFGAQHWTHPFVVRPHIRHSQHQRPSCKNHGTDSIVVVVFCSDSSGANWQWQTSGNVMLPIFLKIHHQIPTQFSTIHSFSYVLPRIDFQVGICKPHDIAIVCHMFPGHFMPLKLHASGSNAVGLWRTGNCSPVHTTLGLTDKHESRKNVISFTPPADAMHQAALSRSSWQHKIHKTFVVGIAVY